MTPYNNLLHSLIVFSTHILTRRMTCTPSLCSSGTIFSTHILTRRMTRMQNPHTEIQLFFNSHPHKEDDICLAFFQMRINFFNSHPHKEDDGETGTVVGLQDFSTHILTRRMTYHLHNSMHNLSFQLTSSQGG